jgi:hypothetical protein
MADIPRGIAAEAADRVDREWLITARGKTLHHATPTHAQSVALAEHRGRGITFTCGRTAAFACFPYNDEQYLSKRCARCCAATSTPAGRGSPIHDPACTELILKQSSYPR